MGIKAILCVLVLVILPMLAIADEVDDLIQDLKYGTSDVREGASMELMFSRDSRAVVPLIEALKDEDAYVRTCAATALGEIGDDRAINPLMEALETEADYSAKNMEQEALDKLRSM
jgi:HEAT repeat protein